MNTNPLVLKALPLVPFLFITLLFSCNQKPISKKGIDLGPLRELALLDRHSAEGLRYQDIDNILERKACTHIPSIGINACVFAWGGETGGPFTRLFCFYQDTPAHFQRQFIYEGEYAMSRMLQGPIKSGKNHALGHQLTQLGKELGPQVYLSKEKMKDLMVYTMKSLADSEPIRKSFMDSLDISTLKKNLDHEIRPNEELIKTIQMVKKEMTINPNPDVVFFNGELTYGIWKGTVRQYDHTGLICIELEYLNGEYAYTVWL